MTGIQRRKKNDEGMPSKLTAFDIWVIKMRNRLGTFKACVAIANKLARIAWAVLARCEIFNFNKSVAIG